MYGLVNQALEDFVKQGFGDAAWKQIRDNAGVSHEMFVSMDSYPDEVTFKLVMAATEVLNLDNLHSHVGLTFPALRPPSFSVERIDGGGGLLLHYRSQRTGLAPMVIGLLKGLGRRFSQEISVHQTAHRGLDDHDIFRIDYIGLGELPKQ